MFDRFIFAAMLNWTYIDSKRAEQFKRKMITAEQYKKYISNRKLVDILLRRGSVELNSAQLHRIDAFISELYYEKM